MFEFVFEFDLGLLAPVRPLVRRAPHRWPLLAVLAAMASGCPAPEGSSPDDDGAMGTTGSTSTDDGSSSSAATSSSGDGADSTGATVPPDEALELLDGLAGLWVAPVTSMTSVGDFPIMAMDIRPADDRTLFSRVDLDADNNLRFAFAVEEHDGEPTLVFRNGGEFLGLLRDTRAGLVEHDPTTGTWRFCALTGGCDYVEAELTLDDPDRLVLSAEVFGRSHMHWEGVRREDRPLDGTFPYDISPGAADDPFPTMPSLRVTVTWPDPLPAPTEAWIILSTTDCGLTPGTCWPSRFLRAQAEAGATSVELVLEQIHAGDYAANAVLDRNGNLAGTLFPDMGDRVSLPNQDILVAPAGESTAMVPLLLEL